MLARWLGLSVLVLTPPAVLGLEVSEMQACAKLDDAEARLQCYDRAVGREPTDKTPATSTPDDAPNAAVARGGAELEPERVGDRPAGGGLAKRWRSMSHSGWARFFTPYKPVYALPVSYNAWPNEDPTGSRTNVDIDNLEVKFQFSFKSPLWRNLLVDGGDLWFGYTQLSFWQAYNREFSSPFRETNYEPELIYSLRTDYRLFGLHGQLLTLSLNHQSNGRSEPFSRSWNRLIGGVVFDNGNFGLQLRGWWRIPEESSNDDNPNIEEFVGRSELLGVYRRNRQTFSLMLRSNLEFGEPRGAVQANWVFPLGGPLQGYMQWFYGYGESLTDYDHINNRFSLGLSLLDWL